MTPIDEPNDALKGVRALIVEDDPQNAALLAIVLGEAGCEVRVTRSAEEARLALEGFRAQVIVLDLALPGMDGVEFVRRLKAEPTTRGIAVIAVTASDARGEALAAGCSDFVRKPLDVGSFPLRVRAQLRASR
jgi:DNA-binding response OmpR family regulator